MQRIIPRSALLACCVAAATAVSAGPALAAVTTTTVAAAPITATTAILNGSVDPGGAAVTYAFEYWPASKPNAVLTTPTISLGSGFKTSLPLLVEIEDLKPSTVYRFQLLTSTGTAGSKNYPLTPGVGGVLTFKTASAGKVTLRDTKLKVQKRKVSIAFTCASTLTCQGKVSITARGKIDTKTETVACGSASFTIAAGAKLKVITSRVSANCDSLLSSAAKSTIKAKLTARFTTDQPALSKNVSLTS